MTSVTGGVGGLRIARAYLRVGLVLTALLFAGIPALTVLDNRWGRPVLSPLSLLVLLCAVLVITAHVALVRPRAEPLRPRVQLVAVATVALAVTALVVVGLPAPRLGILWFLTAGLAVSVLLSVRGWRRRDLGAAAATIVVAALAATVLGFPLPAGAFTFVQLAVLLAAAPVTDLGSIGLIRVFNRLEESRRLADELATARERARIAAELHDVQGHSLHAIALHAELTERLVVSDPQAAARHAHTVRTLAADALAETRSLVRGYRDADLGAELRNAAGLLRAAGADATVQGDPSTVPADHASLLGPVVREAATNVLRHSDPARVGFTVRRAGDRTELEVCNDGVPTGPDAAGSDPDGGTGLAGLTDRITSGGGTIEAGPDGDGGWRLRVVLLSGAGEASR